MIFNKFKSVVMEILITSVEDVWLSECQQKNMLQNYLNVKNFSHSQDRKTLSS